MMKSDTGMFSRATGEELPDWLTPEDDTVVEGVGDLIVREEDDGTWSVVRQVDGTMPEVDPGHPTQEIAMKLARAYSEGGRILIERRVSKEIVAARIRKGMVAKYGGNPVVVIGVEGNDIQVLPPDGADKYVDISELTEIREAQDPEMGPAPFFGEMIPAESPEGMMAGEYEEEEEERARREREEEESPEGMMAGEYEEELEGEEEERARLEGEEEELRDEVEDELSGLMIGPPVYFAQIEPTPGLRQSPLGASKTAAVHISQEKGEMPDLRIKPSEMIDLYASIGIPLTKEAHHVKIGEIFLVFDEGSGSFRLEDEIINGAVTPMTAGMTEVEAQEVLQNHTDLPEAIVTAALIGAKENGHISLGDRLGFLVRSEIFLEPVEDAEGLVVITEDGMAITDPMDEAQAHITLLDATSLDTESIQRAVEMAMRGNAPRIANIKIAKEAPICKKCNQRHWPFQPCPGTSQEKEKSPEKAEEKAEEKEAVQVTGKEAPVCKKCGKHHWPFHPCPSGGSEKADEKKDLEKSDEPATTAGKVRMYFDWNEFYSDVMPQLSNGEFQRAFAEVASSPPESTAAQEEQDIFDEELLLFGREASRRKLPDASKLRFSIRSIAALVSDPDVEGQVAEYRGTDDDVSYLLDMPTGSQVWFKDAELKPTSNPDTTTVPWPERTKRIVDPENKRQDAEFKQDLNRKTGQPEAPTVPPKLPYGEERISLIYADADLEDAAINAVGETIPKDLIQATAENIGAEGDPFDAAFNIVQEYKEPLLEVGRAALPDMGEESPDEEAFLHYARNVITWDLPRPREAKKTGARIRIAQGEMAPEAVRDFLTANAPTGSEVFIDRYVGDYTDLGEFVPDNQPEALLEDFEIYVGALNPSAGPPAMSVGLGAKLKANYETENTELQQLRDMGIVGRIVELNEKDAAIAFGDNVLLIGHSGLEVVGNFFRECTIRKCQPGDRDPKRPADEQVWCLYAKSSGDVLGRHSSEKEAREQEKAIKAQGGLQVEAPGEFGGEPGTIAEPAPKGSPISAPPGAPSRGRERKRSPAEVCICPVSGKEFTKQAGVPCSSMENPEHPGVKLVVKPQSLPQPPDKKPGPVAAVSTEAHCTTGEFLTEYADCVVKRVQSGILTPADALKEINATAKEWSWSAPQKKYVKQRLEGNNPDLPEMWALASKRPFDSGRAPAQDSVSGGGVKARDIRVAQSDIATLLKELPRGDAQSTIRSLDDPAEVSMALEGLGWGDDTDEVRQWLIDAPGMTEAILQTYAQDPESTNRLVALRAMAERFPQADVSPWFNDDFPFIAEKARELASGVPSEEALPPAAPPQVPQIPPVPGEVPQVAKHHNPGPPGSAPPSFPEDPGPPEADRTYKPEKGTKKRKKSVVACSQLMLTHDTSNDQYVLYNMDFGLVSPSGADAKQIKGQLKAYGLDDALISDALKEAKACIVHIVASKREAQQDVEQFVQDAVQDAITELSPHAPRANIIMSAMDKFAALTADLGLDPQTFHGQLKKAIDAELDNYSRPEIPGSHQEFTQIAETKMSRTYDDKEKKQRINDLGKHGIPLKETFEKECPEDIPPGRRLSTGESRNGFTTGDNVRDLAVPELTGIVEGFGTGDTIRVAMNVSSYCTEGSIGLYLPDGLLNLGPSDA